MEFPEQEPAEESAKQNEDKIVEASSTPALVDEDAVRKGLIYPPPPSFYQNLQSLPPTAEQPNYGQPVQPAQPVPANSIGAPAQMPGNAADQQTVQGQQVPQTPQAPQGFYSQVPPGYPGYPGYPPPYAPPFVQQPPAKKSRRWLWITLSILGVVLLLSCGLCGWAAYSFFAPAVQGVTGSLNVVDDYYSNLQSENYAAAFNDINTQYQLRELTETQFAQQAIDRYTSYGAILSYSPGQPAYAANPNGGFDFTRFTISVDVKRAKLSYTSTLYLRKIGNEWKITYYDSL
jgi:hypothetical protein